MQTWTCTDQNTAHDDLVRNALQYNLIPIGDVPRDGSCMFHAVAQSLNELDGTVYTQQDIRIAVVNWLRTNAVMDNGVDLRNFINNRSWEEYLEAISNNEWGGHLCLLAMTNIYRIAVAIVSSQNNDIHFLNVEETHNKENIIYLGHEFETQYIYKASLFQRKAS